MVRASQSLVANIELLMALHPEKRVVLVFLRTWLELSRTHGSSEAFRALLSPRWLEPLQQQGPLWPLWDLACEETKAPVQAGFGFFEDETAYYLNDGTRSLQLNDIVSLHPCLEVMTYQGAHSEESQAYYLVEGSFHAGPALGLSHDHLDEYVVAMVRSTQQQTEAVPLRIRGLRLMKERSHAAA